jgi:hypothetical protein
MFMSLVLSLILEVQAARQGQFDVGLLKAQEQIVVEMLLL